MGPENPLGAVAMRGGSLKARYHRAMRLVAGVVTAVTGVILALQVVLLTYSAVQNLGGFRRQTPWVTEVATLGLVQLAFLGAAIALRAGAHQGIDALTERFPPRLRRAVEVFDWLVIAAFGAVFAVLGGMYVASTWSGGSRLASADLPTWPFYLCYPVSGALMLAFSLEGLIGCLWPEEIPPACGAGGDSAPDVPGLPDGPAGGETAR